MPDAAFDLHMWMTFAIIVVAIAAYIAERWPLEMVSASVIAALMVFFHFLPFKDAQGEILLRSGEFLSGFANPAVITIMALLVIGQGLYQTSALEAPPRRLAGFGTRHPWLTFFMIVLTAATISAFMNNTPVVVIFIPIITTLALRLRFSPSKVLIPLSFLTILGGMTTVIGSSTNLLVADSATRSGLDPIGFFDFFIPGIVLFVVGGLYVLLIAPRLLRARQTMISSIAEGGGGKQFIVQIEITPDHPLDGKAAISGLFPSLKEMTIRLIQRGEHAHLPPFEDVTLQTGDVIVLAATRSILAEALKAKNSILASDLTAVRTGHDGNTEPSAREQGSGEIVLVEAVVAPGSRLVGRAIEQTGFRARTGCIVLGIQRRGGMLRSRLDDILVEAGDVLLIMGPRDRLHRSRRDRDILVLEASVTELPDARLANRALAIFVATVTAAASGALPVVIAALTGSVVMVATGCMNVRQACRAFDFRIYMLIAAGAAMALALEKTSGAYFLAHHVVTAFHGAGVSVVLSALFLLIAILTNLLSNQATALLFTPIAIGMARTANVDPLPFVYAVIFAANCCFATPIGYQTNLLVMGPGHYRFSDFLRAGVPLVLLIWLTFSLFAPWYYGLA